MKSLLVFAEPASTLRTVLVDVEKPVPKPDQVLIKVIVSGTNQRDAKYPTGGTESHSSDDIAGIVEAVGPNVIEFKHGDRVAAYHEIGTPYGSFGEYAIAESYCTFHIPTTTSFEEAATIPLTALTAAYGLFQRLKLPTPWNPATQPTPLVIYNASGAVGAFAIKLAKLANIHPIIGIAGAGSDFVKSTLGADFVVDYRRKQVAEDIRTILDGKKLYYAFDTISMHGSYQELLKVLEPGLQSKLTLILPRLKYEDIKKGSVDWNVTEVYDAHSKDKPWERDFAYMMSRLFSKWLSEGKLQGHPFQVLEGGLLGVEQGLKTLLSGQVSATKLVLRLSDTPEL